MKKKDFVEWLETDPSAIDVVALKYLKSKDMNVVERAFEIPLNSLTDILSDFPEIREKFDESLKRITVDVARRELYIGVIDALKTLQSVFMDDDSDTKNRSQAATTFLNTWMKLSMSKHKDNDEKQQDDGLDDLITAIKKSHGKR